MIRAITMLMRDVYGECERRVHSNKYAHLSVFYCAVCWIILWFARETDYNEIGLMSNETSISDLTLQPSNLRNVVKAYDHHLGIREAAL